MAEMQNPGKLQSRKWLVQNRMKRCNRVTGNEQMAEVLIRRRGASYTTLPKYAVRPGKHVPKQDGVGRILVVTAVCLSPILDSLPGIGGFSFAWILYGCLSIWVIARSPHSLLRTIKEPLFVGATLFAVVGLASEVMHPKSAFVLIFRFVQTAGGAVLIASLCRNRETLSWALRSLAGFACCISLILIATSYGQLRAADVEEFAGASSLREQVFTNQNLFYDLNRWAFICGLGAPIALAMFARETRTQKKVLWAGVATVCLLGATMPLSRSGIVVTLMACMAVLVFGSRGRLALVTMGICVLICAYALAPAALMQRFKGSGGFSSESEDPRQRILVASVKSLPEYWLKGVGAGNYWDSWAVSRGLGNKFGRARGAHNSFFAVWIFWGLPGLLSFLVLLWLAFKCLPRGLGRDRLALCLLGLSVAMLVRLFFTHTFYVKDFSAILGLLAAGRLWIWPSGQTPSMASYARPRRRRQVLPMHQSP